MQSSTSFQCEYCRDWFSSEANRNRHRAAPGTKCNRAHKRVLEDLAKNLSIYDPHDIEDIPRDDEPEEGYREVPEEAALQASFNDIASMDIVPPLSPHTVAVEDEQGDDDAENEFGDEPNSDSGQIQSGGESGIKKQKRHIIYHQNRSKVLRKSQTRFEARYTEEQARGQNPFCGFGNAEAFEHAEWALSSNISQRTESNLLKTRLVSRFYVGSPDN